MLIFEETESFEKATKIDYIYDDRQEGKPKDPVLLASYIIMECRKIQSTNSDQMIQMRIHKAIANKVLEKKEKLFYCDICNKYFSREDKVQTQTRENLYTCEVCNRQLTLKDSLAKHLIVHSNEKPFVCVICNNEFSRKDALRKHIKRHPNEKPFSFEICSKEFAMKDTLGKHMRVHTKEKPYRCEICNKNSQGRKPL